MSYLMYFSLNLEFLAGFLHSYPQFFLHCPDLDNCASEKDTRTERNGVVMQE
jgi:hypothetical protein